MLPFKLNMQIDKFLKQFILKETDDLLLVAETNLGDEGKPFWTKSVVVQGAEKVHFIQYSAPVCSVNKINSSKSII